MPHVVHRCLGGGLRVVIELPPEDSRMTLGQLAEMTAFVRSLADSLERAEDMARRCIAAKGGPPS